MLKLRSQLDYAEFNLQVDCQIKDYGVTVIWGRSGSGKTSLLRSIAGLQQKSRADISFRQQVWQKNEKHLVASHKRPIAYVFQQTSLFTHLTVLGNLNFAQKRASKNDANELFDFTRIVEMLNIKSLLNRSVGQLSGGEQQRVAIARALLIQPQLLLMDEPLASLDYQHKQEVLPYLIKIKQQLKLPIVYITHDINEAMQLADEIIHLEQGKIINQGPALEVIDTITSQQSNIGEQKTVIEGRVAEIEPQWQLAKVSFAGGDIWITANNLIIEQEVRLLIRAKDISLTLTPHQDSSIQNILPAKVVKIEEANNEASSQRLVELQCDQQKIKALVTARAIEQLSIQAGQSLWLQIKSVAVL